MSLQLGYPGYCYKTGDANWNVCWGLEIDVNWVTPAVCRVIKIGRDCVKLEDTVPQLAGAGCSDRRRGTLPKPWSSPLTSWGECGECRGRGAWGRNVAPSPTFHYWSAEAVSSPKLDPPLVGEGHRLLQLVCALCKKGCLYWPRLVVASWEC